MELSPYLFLPNDEEPRMVVTYSSERQCWFRQSVTELSRPEMESALQHREVLTCADKQWRVFLADSADATKQQLQEKQLDEFEFVFDLSLDEENTGLRLEHQHRHQAVNLGERSHHYLLLHLARQRAVEASRGLDQRSQGWIDSEQLARDLGVDMSHINILIFRARKQLAQSLAGSFGSEQLVERGRGRVRFGCPRFRIYKGEHLAYALPLAESAYAPRP